jgi:hypothetical protein
MSVKPFAVRTFIVRVLSIQPWLPPVLFQNCNRGAMAAGQNTVQFGAFP